MIGGGGGGTAAIIMMVMNMVIADVGAAGMVAMATITTTVCRLRRPKSNHSDEAAR